ncbi:ABC transporter permease subunit [Mycoplasmopsis cynos]|uniref:ABC transporter permease subunit n=2 Tax=Mycoplasmopsis cynos TaxID=171284 RepID=UPI003A5C7BF3
MKLNHWKELLSLLLILQLEKLTLFNLELMQLVDLVFVHELKLCKIPIKGTATSGYWQSLMVTSFNVLLSVFIKIFITFLMGYAFSLRNWRFKGFIWFLALALLVLPEVALLSGQYSVVIKTNLRSSLFTILLAMVLPFSASIFNTVMYKNAFEAIPGRIKEVSLVDGASGLKYLFKVAFPMVIPTTLTIVILTALASFKCLFMTFTY